MYKNCYEREAMLYMEEARRQAAQDRLARQVTAGRRSAYAPLLAALGRLLTRTGERLQGGQAAAQERRDLPGQQDMLLTN